MKDSETKQQFIVLRALGKSYETISRELNVSKPTLLKWGTEYEEEIANRKAIELEALREKYWLTTEARVALYGAARERVIEEIEKRDLSDVPLPKLFELLAKFDAQLDRACPEPVISAECDVAVQRALRERLSSHNGNGSAAPDTDSPRADALRADDVTALQLNTYQRFAAGKINASAAKTELAIANSMLKGIELAD
ncbi:MAG: hypothetical protein ACXV3D_10275, partial [Halobacteriota archaeon]